MLCSGLGSDLGVALGFVRTSSLGKLLGDDVGDVLGDAVGNTFDGISVLGGTVCLLGLFVPITESVLSPIVGDDVLLSVGESAGDSLGDIVRESFGESV